MDYTYSPSVLWGLNFNGIPCGAVEKDGDPVGQIIHDCGFYREGSYSVNAAHASTSVKYISPQECMRILDRVK